MTTKNNHTDRRKHTRISFELPAELKLAGNAVFQGKMINLSFSGAYLTCFDSANVPVGETGTFKLVLQPGPRPQAIHLKCRTVRSDDAGVGINFISIDIEGYHQFKNLMTYNSPEPDKLFAELEKNPGLEIHKGDS
jgi:hypothetical protein